MIKLRENKSTPRPTMENILDTSMIKQAKTRFYKVFTIDEILTDLLLTLFGIRRVFYQDKKARF